MSCLSDNALARLVAGELQGESHEDINRHLASCESCHAVLGAYGRRFAQPGSASMPTPEGASTEPTRRSIAARTELVVGERISRFLVCERLGSGGMGVVYRAHDPELDRYVALKLLRVDANTPDADLRHRREAQAMAQLSHPNVVAVYDVGIDQDRVFIASEYIHGVTLQQWLEASPRSCAEIVDVFIEAGRGLCAAHEAGLVHRDFKPSNVMVGEDERICVVDFGLASSGARRRDEPLEPSSESDLETTALTRTGAILGTPAFLAPECIAGRSVTQAADQFSFCVALYRAVHGVAPFGNGSFEDRQARIREARLTPGQRRVSSWLERILRRGLAYRPEDRYPSLATLLEHLQAGRRRGRRALGLGAWALALSAAVGIGYAVAKAPEAPAHDLCEPRDGLAGVWDATRRARIDRVAKTVAPAYAGEAWSLARVHLDAYARDFETSRARACAASKTSQSSAWLDCLARRRASLDLLVDLLEEDSGLLAQAPKLVAELDSLASCETAAHDQEAEPASQELVAELERAELLLVAGRYDQARELAVTTAQRATADGPGSEIEARAHVVLGRALAELGETDAALEALDEAIRLALAHRHMRPVLEAWIELVDVESILAVRPEQAERWAAMAEALLASQPPQPRLEAHLATNLGVVLARTGEFEQAIAQHERALGLISEDVDRIDVLNNLATALLRSGDLERAERNYLEVLELAERTLGPGHPRIGTVWSNLSAVYCAHRRWADARAAVERSVAIRRAALGPTHPDVGTSLGTLGAILTQCGEPEQAFVVLEEALLILEKSRGAKHPSLVNPLLHLADACERSGRFEDALSFIERAEVNVRESYGTRHSTYANVLYSLGRVYKEMGRLQDARTQLQRALELYTEQLGPDHHHTRDAQIMLGHIERDLGHWAEARALLEPLVPEQGELSVTQAHAAFSLARSLPASEQARARLLAERARSTLAAQNLSPDTVAKIDAFLGEN